MVVVVARVVEEGLEWTEGAAISLEGVAVVVSIMPVLRCVLIDGILNYPMRVSVRGFLGKAARGWKVRLLIS